MGRHLEATDKPIEYRLKTGEDFTSRPGVPMEVLVTKRQPSC